MAYINLLLQETFAIGPTSQHVNLPVHIFYSDKRSRKFSWTDSMEWEANSHSASQVISHPLWSLKVHYRVHNSLALVRMLIQMHLVHIFPHYFPNIRYDITLPSAPMSSEWSLPFRFSDQNLVNIFTPHCVLYAPHILSSLTLSP